jgi:hypothetical protein
MQEEPSIFDYLDWESGLDKQLHYPHGKGATYVGPGSEVTYEGGVPSVRQFGTGFIPPTSIGVDESIASSLYGLLEGAGLAPEEIGYGYEHGFYGGVAEGWSDTEAPWKTFEKQGTLGVENIISQLMGGDVPFGGMTREQLIEALSGERGWYEKIGLTPEMVTDPTGTEEGDIRDPRAKFTGFHLQGGAEYDEMLDALMGLQEGMNLSRGIIGKYDLSGKLAATDVGEERALAKARESYIPGEIISRYAGLQGKDVASGSERAEAEYLADIFGTQREVGRERRTIYKELEDKLYGGQARWLENMLS